MMPQRLPLRLVLCSVWLFFWGRGVDNFAAMPFESPPVGTAASDGRSESLLLDEPEYPNLVFAKLDGWSSPVIISPTSGTTINSDSIFSNDPIWLDWCLYVEKRWLLPQDKPDIYIDLYVDDIPTARWKIGSYWLSYWYYGYAWTRDFYMPPLPAGPHVFRIVLDSTNAVVESNEEDNVYRRTVFVIQANRPPDVSAGDDFAVRPGEVAELSGTVSDSEGDSFTVRWMQVSGEPVVDLIDSDKLQARFVAPEVNAATTLTFRLSAYDGDASGSDKVEVTIDPNFNAPPTVDAGPDLHVVAGDVVRLAGSASDSDGDSVALSWLQVVGTTDAPEITLTNPTASEIEFVAPASDRDYRMDFWLTARDGPGKEAFDEVSIFVDSPDPHRVFIPYSLSPTEGTALPNLANTFIGAVLANPSDLEEPRAEVSAIGAQGDELDFERRTIGAQAQSAFLTTEFTSDPGAAAIRAFGWDAPVQGFFLAGDSSLRRLDGIGGAPAQGRELCFLNGDIRAGRTTVVNLFNDGPAAAEASLSLHSEDGLTMGTASLQIAPQGTYRGTLDELFPASGELSGGYLLVSSNVPLSGFELMADGESFWALPGLAVQEVKRLTAPHFIVGPDGGTEVRLLSRDSVPRSYEVTVFDDAGVELARRQGTAAPQSMVTFDLAEVLEAAPGSGETLTGYFRVDVNGSAQGGKFVGALTFQGPKWASSLPLIARGLKEVDFLHVAQSAELDLFTGLAVLNPGVAATGVTVTVFDEDGEESAEISFELAPGQRRVDLLNGTGLMGADFEQVGGHIRVRGTEPVNAFVLFGESSLAYLAAIEGQAPYLKAGIFRVSRSSCGTNVGPEVVAVEPDPLRGEYTAGVGRTATLKVRFRDSSQTPSGLDSVRTGIDLIGWGLLHLHRFGITPNSSARSTEDPTEREAELSFVVPEGVDGAVTLSVTATDVLGCPTQLDLSVFLGERAD